MLEALLGMVVGWAAGLSLGGLMVWYIFRPYWRRKDRQAFLSGDAR